MATVRDIYLDPVSYDFELDSLGDLQMSDDLEVVKTNLQVVFKADRGAYAFDLAYGVPWRREILRSKKPDVPAVTASLKAIAATQRYVHRIIDWDSTFTPRTRKLDVEGVLDTDFGPLPLSYTV